jgi:hypothetical protein
MAVDSALHAPGTSRDPDKVLDIRYSYSLVHSRVEIRLEGVTEVKTVVGSPGMELATFRHLPASSVAPYRHFIPSSTNILLSTLFPNVLSLCKVESVVFCEAFTAVTMTNVFWEITPCGSSSVLEPHGVISQKTFAFVTLDLCSSLNVRDQVSHPYRTTVCIF